MQKSSDTPSCYKVQGEYIIQTQRFRHSAWSLSREVNELSLLALVPASYFFHLFLFDCSCGRKIPDIGMTHVNRISGPDWLMVQSVLWDPESGNEKSMMGPHYYWASPRDVKTKVAGDSIKIISGQENLILSVPGAQMSSRVTNLSLALQRNERVNFVVEDQWNTLRYIL